MESRTSSPRCVGVALALVLGLACGCRQSLPTAPSELETGITVYEHANFLGESAHITRDISDLRDFRGPCQHVDTSVPTSPSISHDWNDCISSVRIAPGWRATIYRDTGYRDDALDINADVPNLQQVSGDCPVGGLNDCVSSVRIRR